MKSIKIAGYISIILICGGSSSCHSQENKNLIENWKSYPIPTNPDTLQKINYSLDEWTVFLKNNKTNVAKYEPDDEKKQLSKKIKLREFDDGKMHISFLQVDDGFLIGFNRGEWGGYLSWFSTDGKKHYQISGDEIVQFIKRDQKYYAIQGLAHLGMSEGSIISIYKEAGKWRSKEYIKLPKAPEAIGLDNDKNFMIITSKNLLKIDSALKVTTLIERGIWYDSLYPNSIVIKDNVLYAGMRAGVFKYDLSTHQQNWLLPY